MKYALLPLIVTPFAAFADGVDIYVLGEAHDNPAHHARQAELVADYGASALVFEMLTSGQAAEVTPQVVQDQAALEAALDWASSGWPDFAMYYPIFTAAPQAPVFGAGLPRSEIRRSMGEDIAAIFGPDAAAYGLTEDLPPEQQTAREALQMAAHCDALPEQMLPMMVDIQRLRDAYIARVALAALESYGPPVVVITGNGHARTDWGAPAYIARVAPDVTVQALGQGEVTTGDPSGSFDNVEITEGVDRGDPCDAFRDG